MDLEQLGNLGEFFGALAVILSLIYLSLQVRQNTLTAKNQSIREVSRDAHHFWLRLADPELMRIFRRAVIDFDSLSHNDQGVAGALLGAFFVMAQTSFAVRTSSRPSQIERTAASYIAAPGLAIWWNGYKNFCQPTFVAQIEQIVRDGAPTIPEVWPWYVLEESDLPGYQG